MDEIVDGDVFTCSADINSDLPLFVGIMISPINRFSFSCHSINEALDSYVIELESHTVVNSKQGRNQRNGCSNGSKIQVKIVIFITLQLV